MSISKTELVNKALTQVGANPIVNLDDSSQNARVVNRVYEIALRSVLSECKWNFATKRLSLTVSADTLDWYDTGEVYVYKKPADMIRIFGVSSTGVTWREEQDYIISDTANLGIRYVYFLDNPTKYTAKFVDALIDKLCSDIAYMIVNSASLGELYLKKYTEITLPAAISANSQTGTQQVAEDQAWELAKYTNQSFNA